MDFFLFFITDWDTGTRSTISLTYFGISLIYLSQFSIKLVSNIFCLDISASLKKTLQKLADVSEPFRMKTSFVGPRVRL